MAKVLYVKGNPVGSSSNLATEVVMSNGNTVETEINNKANEDHSHTVSDISDFPTSLPASDVSEWAKADDKPSYNWTEINEKPESFTPASHNHDDMYYTESEVDDKYAQLNLQDVELQIDGYVTPIFGTIRNSIEGNVYHKRIGRVALWELGWAYDVKRKMFVSNIPIECLVIGNSTPCEIYTQKLTTVPFNDVFNNVVDNAISVRNASSPSQHRRVCIAYNSADGNKQVLQDLLLGQYLFYELAQEETYNINSSARIDNLESAIGNTVNLLNPTLRDTVQDGITVHYDNGSYILNGTASDTTVFEIGTYSAKKGTPYKLLGCPKGGSIDSAYFLSLNYFMNDIGNNDCIGTPSEDLVNKTISIAVFGGTTCNNLVFKPMLTTNLSATIDGFVPYTGTTGKLNSDVAELRKVINVGNKVPIISTDEDLEIITSYSYYQVINNIVTFQIQFRTTNNAQHYLATKLPRSAFGNYLYYTKLQLTSEGTPFKAEARVDASGTVRVTSYGREQVSITGCYGTY